MAAPHAPRMPARDVAAVVVGNGLEFYDFIAYAFFALQISRTFFPARTPGTSLLLSLATFGAGFLMRPLGAAVLGRLASEPPPDMLLFVADATNLRIALRLVLELRRVGRPRATREACGEARRCLRSGG